jgi:hypothetical protein
MFTYYYPQVQGGYRWNLLQRCLHEVGIEPMGISDVGEQTVIQFSRELTALEKTKLDTLMADNPTFPPSTGVGLIIKDIWENFEAFKADCQLPGLRIFYTAAQPGGAIDQIYLWHPTTLNTQQKNRVKTAYSNLFITV